MKRLLWGSLIVILIIMTLLAACTSTSTSTTTQTTTKTTMTGTTTTQPPSSTAVTSTTTTNWWDKFGTPQYGGTINVVASQFMAENFDVYNMVGADLDLYYEALFEPSWTLDRNIWSMKGMYYPDEVLDGHLLATWDIPDPQTIIGHVRQGIKWQNKPPVNGREFTAYDIQSHYDRILGHGEYTEPAPMYIGMAANFDTVTATDKYTVEFKFKQPSAQNLQVIADRFAMNVIEAPEFAALKPAKEGDPDLKQDWHNAVGTAAWILNEYVSGSSFKYIKNPDYWGTDPRHPENQLPYADNLTVLIITDSSTKLAALRTGQIATLDSLTPQQAIELKKTNPEIQQTDVLAGASGVGLRVDNKPFTDIRVRKALDMAIDRDAIAKSFYNGASTGRPVGFISSDYKGYCYSYDEWPQSLKDEYAYNPEGAKELLAEAGYPGGFKTNCVTTTDTVMLQLLQIFKAYFLDIGVDMEIRTMDSVTEQAFTRAGKHDQMSAQGMGQTFPPTRAIDNFYSKGATDAVYYGLNNAPDTVYDELHDKFLAATDSGEAKLLLQQMDKRIIEQHYAIAGPESYGYVAWLPSLKGYSGENISIWGRGVTLARLWLSK